MSIKSKRAAEVRAVTVDFRDKLSAGELLTGTPTVAEVTTSQLTISGIVLTVSPDLMIASNFVPTSKGVQFLVAGGTSGTLYTLRITVSTAAEYPQTLIKEITLRVN